MGMHFDSRGVYVGPCIVEEEEEPGFTPYWTKGPLLLKEDPYAKLMHTLHMAYVQASAGKGKERHAKVDEKFEDQKICEIRRRVGSGYTLGQAIKKCIEAQRLPKDRAIAELLGAINYISAEIIVLEEGPEDDTSGV